MNNNELDDIRVKFSTENVREFANIFLMFGKYCQKITIEFTSDKIELKGDNIRYETISVEELHHTILGDKITQPTMLCKIIIDKNKFSYYHVIKDHIKITLDLQQLFVFMNRATHVQMDSVLTFIVVQNCIKIKEEIKSKGVTHCYNQRIIDNIIVNDMKLDKENYNFNVESFGKICFYF